MKFICCKWKKRNFKTNFFSFSCVFTNNYANSLSEGPSHVNSACHISILIHSTSIWGWFPTICLQGQQGIRVLDDIISTAARFENGELLIFRLSQAASQGKLSLVFCTASRNLKIQPSWGWFNIVVQTVWDKIEPKKYIMFNIN